MEFAICNGKERLKNKGTKFIQQKPEALLQNSISTSNKNDFILDPF